MATADQYAEWIVANQAKKGTPEFETVAAAYKQARGVPAVPSEQTSLVDQIPVEGTRPNVMPQQELSWAEKNIAPMLESVGIGGLPNARTSMVGRVAEGMARPGGGVAQLLTGGNQEVTNRINQARQQAEAGIPAGDTNIAGYVGEALSPTTLVPATRLATPASMLGKAGQGAAIGGAAALSAPVGKTNDFAKQKIDQALTGLAIGGAIPPILWAGGKLLSGAYNTAIEPWLNPNSIKGRALIEAAGDKYDEVVSLLKAKRQIVPGSLPTAGEAAAPAGATKFSALQESARGVLPDEYLARTDAGNAARINALRSVGQDEPALQTAIAERSAVTSPMYEAARTSPTRIDVNNVAGNIDDLMRSNPGNPELMATLGQIRYGLTDEMGNVRSDPQQIASVLDGIKAALAKKENSFIKGQLTEIKNQLADAIPGYQAAQSKFAEMSQPVNQMQIGQFLENKLVPALDEQGRQKAGVYAQALQDAPATIKKATGAPRFEKLSEALTPEQLAVVNSVKEDLARLQRHGTMANLGSKFAPSVIDLATQSMERQAGGKIPNLLNRTAMIANAIVMRLEGKINKKLAAELAAEMLDPSGVAASMAKEKAHQLRNANIADIVSKLITRPAMASSIEMSQAQPLKE